MHSHTSSFLLAVVVGACGSAAPAAQGPAAPAPPAAAAPVAPRTIPLPGGGNGLWWDDKAHALYVTDDAHGQLQMWTDAGDFKPAGAMPTTPDGPGLGAIIKRADGSFVVPSFGFGKTGTIFALAGAGPAVALAGLDGTRRRIALAVDPSGQLYDTYFVVGADKSHTGGVARVAITGANAVETPIATSVALTKAVGVAATATTVYACDQEANKIYAIALADGATTVVASPPSCDQLLLLPHGDLVTGGPSGGVYRIAPGGAITTIASGFAQVRGLAYDAAGKRLFFVEHVKGHGASDQLHVTALRD